MKKLEIKLRHFEELETIMDRKQLYRFSFTVHELETIMDREREAVKLFFNC